MAKVEPTFPSYIITDFCHFLFIIQRFYEIQAHRIQFSLSYLVDKPYSLNFHWLQCRTPAKEGTAKVGVVGLDGGPSCQLSIYPTKYP